MSPGERTGTSGKEADNQYCAVAEWQASRIHQTYQSFFNIFIGWHFDKSFYRNVGWHFILTIIVINKGNSRSTEQNGNNGNDKPTQ